MKDVKWEDIKNLDIPSGVKGKEIKRMALHLPKEVDLKKFANDKNNILKLSQSSIVDFFKNYNKNKIDNKSHSPDTNLNYAEKQKYAN